MGFVRRQRKCEIRTRGGIAAIRDRYESKKPRVERGSLQHERVKGLGKYICTIAQPLQQLWLVNQNVLHVCMYHEYVSEYCASKQVQKHLGLMRADREVRVLLAVCSLMVLACCFAMSRPRVCGSRPKLTKRHVLGLELPFRLHSPIITRDASPKSVGCRIARVHILGAILQCSHAPLIQPAQTLLDQLIDG